MDANLTNSTKRSTTGERLAVCAQAHRSVIPRSAQAQTFDRLGQPWEYDDNLGPLIAAPPPKGTSHETGDGEWVYRREVPELQRLIVARTTTPDRAHHIFDERAKRMHAAEEWMRKYRIRDDHAREMMYERERSPSWRMKHVTVDLRTGQITAEPYTDSDEDDAASEDDKHENERPDLKHKGQFTSKRTAASAPRQARSDAHTRDTIRSQPVPSSNSWDPNATDEELLSLCRIERVPRASTGRPDLKVFTPDQKQHRSRLEALRYMRR